MVAVVQTVSFSLRAQVRSQVSVRGIYDGRCSSWTRLFRVFNLYRTKVTFAVTQVKV
jgi:hypothetical protein